MNIKKTIRIHPMSLVVVFMLAFVIAIVTIGNFKCAFSREEDIKVSEIKILYLKMKLLLEYLMVQSSRCKTQVTQDEHFSRTYSPLSHFTSINFSGLLSFRCFKLGQIAV